MPLDPLSIVLCLIYTAKAAQGLYQNDWRQVGFWAASVVITVCVSKGK